MGGSADRSRRDRPVDGSPGPGSMSFERHRRAASWRTLNRILARALSRTIRVAALAGMLLVSFATLAADPVVPVRFGSYPGIDRVAFEWHTRVEYRVEQSGRTALVTFDRPGRIDTSVLSKRLARFSTEAEVKIESGRLQVKLMLPERTVVRHFRSGNNVVLDLTRLPDTPAPTPTTPSQPAQAAPQKPSPKAATEPDGKPHAVPVEIIRTPSAYRLRFRWTEPVGAAVFMRGPYLWVAFDRRATMDLSRVAAEQGEDRFGPIQMIEPADGAEATVLRLLPPAGLGHAARREEDEWIIDFGLSPGTPDAPVAIAALGTDDPAGKRLFVAIPGVRRIFLVRDPEVGDDLIVAPTTAAGVAVERDRDYPQFRLFATAVGLAAQRRADDIAARTVGNGVEITARGGLLLSEADDSWRPNVRDSRWPMLFDFAAWRRGGPAQFNEDRQALRRAVTAVPEGNRNKARLDLVRFLFAHGYFADALGLLRLIEQEDPELVATAQLRAIRGVAALLHGDHEEAVRQLGHPSLNAQPEAAVWRGALAMVQGDPRTARAQMESGGDLETLYPPPFANSLSLLSIEARIATGDYQGAEKRIDAVLASEPTRPEYAQAIYLRGRLLMAKGDKDGALAVWAELEDAQPSRGRMAAMLDRLDQLLADGKMKPADAIAMLERLRFSWRGDDLEFRALTKLGRLRIASGEYRAGLAAMRRAIAQRPGHPEVDAVGREMAAAFVSAFDEGSRMTPVSAIALFEEFRDLVPKGAAGDALARRLVDRLLAVDLLDRAGAVLEDLVKSRLSGLEKVQTGTKLATIRLLDRKPEAALEALKASEIRDVPDDLKSERLRLEARALADMGKAELALQRLAGDESEQADRLRADIHSRVRNWRGVAQALARIVGTPAADAALTDDQARSILHLAVAHVLAQDREGLRQLDLQLGEQMLRSPYKDLYQVVISQPGAPPVYVDEVVARVNATAPFQSFLGTYRQRIIADAKGGR